MPIKFLTVEQQENVLKNLLNLAKQGSTKITVHPAGFEYTSLMVCFLLHHLSSAETILRMSTLFGYQWFPVTVGYNIVRSMFEIDVTAHYITKKPTELSRLYIDFGNVLKKYEMDACAKHRGSSNPQWREAMDLVWRNHWASREVETMKKFNAVSHLFTHKSGKIFKNWSGKNIRQMASEVDHVEAYDIFYSELSSFAHADIHLADHFLQRRPEGWMWSQQSDEVDVGGVFRHAANFLTCYMKLFSRQIKSWSEAEVENCWSVKEINIKDIKNIDSITD